MDYALLIEERKSTRAFKKKTVPENICNDIKAYHDKECMRLLPDLATECLIFGNETGEVLEGAAGYKDFIIGAPSYIVLLSEPHEKYLQNAGFITEDLSLKLNDSGMGCCFITFADGKAVKTALEINSEKEVAAILAFGYPERLKKRMHVNVITMSKISSKEVQQYFAPKKGVFDLVYLDSFGNTDGVDEKLDFIGDALWEPLLAVSNSPSYMNRQPYALVIMDNTVNFVRLFDEHTGETDAALNVGAAMQHFAAVARSYSGSSSWELVNTEVPGLPEGAIVEGSFKI